MLQNVNIIYRSLLDFNSQTFIIKFLSTNVIVLVNKMFFHPTCNYSYIFCELPEMWAHTAHSTSTYVHPMKPHT